MTEKEAICILRNAAWLGSNEERQKVEEAVEVVTKAIEALNHSEIPNSFGKDANVPSNDTISRQAAINAIRASTSKYTGFMEMEMYTDYDAVEAIEGLPSIQLSRIERELHGKTPEEQYKILYQLMFEYANTFNDARRAVIDWLGE